MLVQFAGEQLDLLPDRAAYWQRARTLFVADTHFGKAAAFRAAGTPVPETVTGADVDRLNTLLRATQALRLVILGDFFHAPAGRAAVTEGRIESWRLACLPTEIVLVRGNHDRGSGDPPEHWRITCVEPGHRLGPFTLTHTPEEAAAYADSPALCGHLHPAVTMAEPGASAFGAATRLRCFLMKPALAVLPAFGRFTGTSTIRPRADGTDRVYVIADDEVIDATPAVAPRRAGV